jgi:hypothetical protein
MGVLRQDGREAILQDESCVAGSIAVLPILPGAGAISLTITVIPKTVILAEAGIHAEYALTIERAQYGSPLLN